MVKLISHAMVGTGFIVILVPKPSAMLLLGSGFLGSAGYGRKKFSKK